MTPDEMKQLAKLLQNMPGLKAVELKDVNKLAALLRESPDICSIEVKGLFGTGVVITRTVAATGPIQRHTTQCGCSISGSSTAGKLATSPIKVFGIALFHQQEEPTRR